MSKIDKLREVELELLEQFIKVCERENLTWYASHGTLLGAVRDSGFLLWDDDIDVAMPSDDYNKLMMHKEWLDERYFLQTPLDSGCHGKLRLFKNGTCAFDKPFLEVFMEGGHHGICIDILPLDEIGDTGYYYISHRTIPKDYFGIPVKMTFENLEINVPQRARKILGLLYGYWNWPSGAEYSAPHNWFFDTETDYTVYVKRYTGWLRAVAEGKKVYLFGAADSLRIWLKEFGKGEQVICTFDNDKNKWGKQAFGVPIRNPQELPALLTGNGIVIIVSIWHQEIGQQLEEMGIKDYYVFLDGLFQNEFKENMLYGECFI